MKRIINILCVISAIVTSIFIVCTFLTSYHFYYIDLIFNSYLPMQIGLIITSTSLAIRFVVIEKGKRRLIYAFLSLLIALISLLFIFLVK